MPLHNLKISRRVQPASSSPRSGTRRPVAEISMALDKLQAETGIYIPIHADGASGAFLARFMPPDLLWDLRLPRVKSINASGQSLAWRRSALAGPCGARSMISPKNRPSM